MNLELGRFPMSSGAARSGRGAWQPRSETLRVRLIAYFLALDAMVVLSCVYLSDLIRGDDREQWWLFISLLLPIYLISAVNAHAYDADIVQRPIQASVRAAKAFFFAFAAVLLIAFSLKASAEFSRVTVSLAAGSSFVLIVLLRYVSARNAARILGGNPFSTVLICDGEQKLPPGDYSIVIASDGYFDPTQDDPQMYDRLSKGLAHADRVVVVCDPDRRRAWANALKGANIQGEILVPELRELAPLGVVLHGETPAMIVAHGPLKLLDRLIKRAFDLTVAGLAIIALAPLLALVAVLIKLNDGGPVFFVQTRIGRSNQMFRMFKFRSMRPLACDGAGTQSTQRADDRITSIGRFIRMTSIDELPQLFNVITGDMSIVGPRPHALGSRAADKLFWEVDSRYWHRHAAKPGLTGLAQIRGYRGATHLESDLVNRLQADLEYLDHWSIWRDLKIILQTFGVVFHHNAY